MFYLSVPFTFASYLFFLYVLLWKRLVLASVMLAVSTVSVCFLFFFFFSDDKVEPGDCRSILVSQCAFCGGWILTLGPLKGKLRDRG